MTKKSLKTTLALFILTLPISCICIGQPTQDNTFDFPYGGTYTQNPTTDLQDEVDIGKEAPEKSIMIKLLEIFGLDTHAFDGDHKFINYARAILNMALGLLGFIALIMVIYTFYTMFSPGDEKGFEKAKGNLVGIFIAIAIVGLAWLIVSLIFRRYKDNWQSNQDKIGENKVTFINNELNNNQIYLTI